MKKIIGILSIGCICCFTACNNGSNTQDSVDSAKDVNDSVISNNNDSNNNSSMDSSTAAMSTTPVSKDDADWAVEAANGGMAEVEMGKVAQDKATNPRLKNFGAMMVADHSKANDQLKQLAATKNITLPTTLSDKEQKDLDNLSKKSGADFDKAYAKMMVDDHKDDISKFEKATTKLKDPDLKSFATQTLPTLRVHLDSIQAISGKK